MTLISMYKRCPRCKKKYSWNPDTGKIMCPHCGILSLIGTKILPIGRNKEELIYNDKK